MINAAPLNPPDARRRQSRALGPDSPPISARRRGRRRGQRRVPAMQQLRATILRMKASTQPTSPFQRPSSRAAHGAGRRPPAVVAPPSSEVPAAAPASLTAAAASSGQRTGAWTDEEVAYARKIVALFESGLLPASFKGRKLNSVLQEALALLPRSPRCQAVEKLGGGSRKTTSSRRRSRGWPAAAKELATLGSVHRVSADSEAAEGAEGRLRTAEVARRPSCRDHDALRERRAALVAAFQRSRARRPRERHPMPRRTRSTL